MMNEAPNYRMIKQISCETCAYHGCAYHGEALIVKCKKYDFHDIWSEPELMVCDDYVNKKSIMGAVLQGMVEE